MASNVSDSCLYRRTAGLNQQNQKSKKTDPNSMSGSIAFQSPSVEGIFQPGELKQLLARLGFVPDRIDHLDREAVQIGSSSSLRAEYREAAEPWVTGTQRPPGQGIQDFDALIAVAGFPKMLARHRDLDIPFQVTQATALDLQRWMAEFRERPRNRFNPEQNSRAR